MSIDNMPDEELDKLFRKSAESLDPPYDPEAWSAMEAKLEQAEGGPPWWHQLLYPTLLLLLIGTGLTVHKLKREPAAIPGQAQVEATLPAPSVDVPEVRSISPAGAGMEPGPESQVAARPPQAPQARTLVTKKAPHLRQAIPAESAMQQAAPPAVWTFHADSTLRTHVTVPASTGIPDSPPLPLAAATPQRPAASATDSASAEARYSRTFLGSLQLMLVAAPDVTSVKFSNPDALSVNAGVLVGIPITKRFSLVTGALWANKVYKAKAEDYAPTPDFWAGKQLPSSIEASCRVLDIPLNVRYKLLGGERDLLTVQAGLSTYLMLDEEYTYYYTYGSRPYSKTREIENQNRHWFGVQNVSVGYSRQLSPVFSVGVEPFVKIPLSGIGDGNVRLTSAGVFFTAGYTIPLRR